MTRVDEFNSFYHATSAQSLQVAYALCGDRQITREATIDAYRRAWRDWAKIRQRDPLAYVRTEMWKLTSLSKGTHLLRRRREDGGDTVLLNALGGLGGDERRLIVLMTLGNVDLDAASREIDVPAEEGIEIATNALSSLERTFGQSIDEIERRLHALGAITRSIQLPPVDVIRKMARSGRRRNTIALVAAAVLFAVLGGLVITDGETFARSGDLPVREKIGAERPDQVLNAKKLDTSNLLTVAQVRTLDPKRAWKIVSTDQNVKNSKPYATCPTKRFADTDPLRVFVRTYETGAVEHERVAQAIEVSRSAGVAQRAYQRLLGWYSNCEHPRVQLVDAYTVKRPFGDFQILRLRSHRFPERTFTVGFSHSGTVTSTLVHEADGTAGPTIEEFARTLNDSVLRVCVDSGGVCTTDIRVLKVNPPATQKAPEFLGIVDLPPIASIDKVWAGTDPVRADKNLAMTLCDRANFTGRNIAAANSRVFLIPEAKELPPQFGIAETVARFTDADKAKAFVAGVSKRVDRCPKDNLSASIDQRRTLRSPAAAGTAWRIAFKVEGASKVYYRTALVRSGATVAQLTFTSAKGFDLTRAEFEQLADRAGQRLVYMR